MVLSHTDVSLSHKSINISSSEKKKKKTRWDLLCVRGQRASGSQGELLAPK